MNRKNTLYQDQSNLMIDQNPRPQIKNRIVTVECPDKPEF